jgi:hypothetical protein
MKIYLLENNVYNLDTLNQGIASAKQYASTINLPLDFTIQNTLTEFTSIPFANEVNANGYIVDPNQIFQDAKRLGFKFDIDSVVCLVFDSSKIRPQPTNPGENGMNLQVPCQWFNTYPDVFAEFLFHEICHYCFARDGATDLTHKKYDPMWNGQFSQKSNIDYYLFLLQKMETPTTPTYQFFNPTSDPLMVGLSSTLMQVLDQARKIANTPFKITSGLRTQQQNINVGGVPNSSHLRGLAADILCTDPLKRTLMLKGFLDCGTPVFLEIAQSHIHCDVDSSIHPMGSIIISELD